MNLIDSPGHVDFTSEAGAPSSGGGAPVLFLGGERKGWSMLGGWSRIESDSDSRSCSRYINVIQYMIDSLYNRLFTLGISWTLID